MNNKVVKNIWEHLAHCQYPQNWQLREQLGPSTQQTKENTALLMEDASFAENELPFHSLMACVAFAYEHIISGDVEKALTILRICEAKFEALAENPNIHGLSLAFSHLVKATEVDFLLRKGDANEAAKIVYCIQKLSEMDNSNKVALRFGFPALFLGSFGSLNGLRIALDYLSKAIKDDPTESTWLYTRAEFLCQLDRGEKLIEKMPREEVFQLLEKALALKRTASYTSLAGNLYRQSAKELSRPVRTLGTRRQGDESKIKRFNQMSYELYCESIKLNPHCVETSFRCARGFLLLPKPYRDLVRAKELLERGMKLASGSRFGNQVMAEFLKDEKPLLALQHYSVCEKKQMYGATMAKIRLEYKLGHRQNYIKKHEDLLELYKNDLDQIQILNELTTFSILVKKNMRKACEYAERMLQHGRLGDFAMQCRPSGAFCTSGFSEVTLYELLIDGIERRLQLEDHPEERRYFNDILNRLRSRKIAPANPDEERKADAIRFRRANFSFYRISHAPRPSSNEQVLSWRKRMTVPPTRKHATP